MKVFICFLIFLGGLMLPAAETIPLQQQLDLITALPGQPKVSFKQYGGYVTVNETVGRSLFYYFAEATSNPETKPLVLWLQGGPGCTSLGNGAWEEIGPFFVKSDGYTLFENQYSWNKLANLLFLDSPSGVGFSYSNETQEYHSDAKTSYDSLIFLTRWFERFPQYKNQDFYIAGESYGGHYVPQLAKRVYDFNKGQTAPFINFKGFLVGNPFTDPIADTFGTFDYYWSHALISDETYALWQQCLAGSPNCTDAFVTAVVAAAAKDRGNIDIYDIYAPVCLQNKSISANPKEEDSSFMTYDPCVDMYVTAYFNRPDVQEALHANVTHLNFTWQVCSDVVAQSYNSTDIIGASVLPTYEELLPVGLKIWVLSGDVDARVPVIGTRYWLQKLNLTTTVPWHPWYLDGQVGGYTQGYDGLTFVTVRDAGHQIPKFQPARAFVYFWSFVTGKSLPTS